jgi:hypothetical protein
MSLGGLFIETPNSFPEATVTSLDFLVQEGQIKADAVVRHVRPKSGLGLKFMAVSEDDRPKLAALITRLHVLSRSSGKLPKGGSGQKEF